MTLQELYDKCRGREKNASQETEQEVLTEEQERLIYSICPSLIPIKDEFSEIF